MKIYCGLCKKEIGSGLVSYLDSFDMAGFKGSPFSCPECIEDLNVSEAAKVLGSVGGKKGGLARAASLSAERRKEISLKAAQTRWARTKNK